MKRKLFNLASAISLLLFLATVVFICGAIVATPFTRKDYKFYSPFHEYTIHVTPQEFKLEILGGTRFSGGFGTPGKHWSSDWVGTIHKLPLGFRYGKSPSDDPAAAFYFGVAIPVWCLVVLFSLLPCLWLWRWYFFPIRLPGRCRRCGYNLTGNTSGMCPECGSAIKSRSVIVAAPKPC